MLWNDEQDKPLQSLRVIDVSVMLTGPYLTRLLAQYGADVIKIEKAPEGDPLRIAQDGVFECLNQGKRSLCLDLKRREAMDAVLRLASEADVFVENFREGVMDKLGLGYAELSEQNPDLIYLSLKGFQGKNAMRAGHDLNFVAASGCGEWFLENGPGYSTFFGDIVGGVLTPLIKLLMHLSNPNRRGMHLQCYMDEGFRSLYFPRAFEAFQMDETKSNGQSWLTGLFSGKMPCSKYYRCRDGAWISVQAIQPKHWDGFCEAIDKAEWKSRREDPTLVPELDKLFQDAPATYWEALAANRDICLFRVIPWQEHLQFSAARPQLSKDPLTWAGFAPHTGLKGSPKPGQDTFSILNSIGYNNKDIADLLSSGVVFQSS